MIGRLKAVLVENPELFEIINGDAELTDRFVQTTAQRLGVDPVTDLRPAVVAGAVRSALIAATDRWSSGDAGGLAESFTEAFDILGDLRFL